MKLTNGTVPVYTVAGSSISRNLPEWLSQKQRKKDPEFSNRVELLQDFEFEEASQCVRVSDDGEWVMSTGTYKPQIHTHYLPNLALSWARHTETINKTFRFLSSDYSKTVHLQEDRSIQFHTPGGCHYSLRIPRYGRDLLFDRSSAELYIPSVGVNANGMGEVFRINLEQGRFLNEFEVDVGGDDFASTGGGALQGGIGVGSVNTGAVASDSHGLLAFGTSLGTVEYWDPRMRTRVAILAVPQEYEGRPEVSALAYHRSGIRTAVGTSSGLVYLYDLRSPLSTLKKDQGYGYPIQHVEFLTANSSTRTEGLESKILSGDKRILKIWNERDGEPWASVEPSVDINCVAWCPDSGMILTANEGKQQHAFFIPQLGPAPKWCAFLDNVVEEMADDPNDPQAYMTRQSGEVYDNYKFVSLPQLRSLNLDHLVGKTDLLRPYMHGYFVAQRLYEEARLITNPSSWEEERAKRVQEKIEKERESRIRGQKKVAAKVNKKLVQRILEREEKNERRRAQRVIEQGGDELQPSERKSATQNGNDVESGGVLSDSRFARLFQDEDFAVDEASREFQQLNPSTQTDIQTGHNHERGLTAVEEEIVDNIPPSSEDESEDGNANDFSNMNRRTDRISSPSYRRTKKKPNGRKDVHLQVSSASGRQTGGAVRRDRSFGSRAANFKSGDRDQKPRVSTALGDKTITFAPSKQRQSHVSDVHSFGPQRKDRRSASGNTFRKM